MVGNHKYNYRFFDTILFDLGNTLIYFEGDWKEVQGKSVIAMASVLQSLEYAVGDQFVDIFVKRLDEYYINRDNEFIEYSTEKVLGWVLEDFGFDRVLPSHVRAALDAMYGVTEQYWHVEKESFDVLRKLQNQGYKIGLVSNAADSKDVRQLLLQSGIESFFKVLAISADIGIRKPHPKIFQIALEQINSKADQAVMVGDTLDADVLGARNAGLSSIWITRRVDEKTQKNIGVSPDLTIKHLSELPDVLSSWALRFWA